MHRRTRRRQKEKQEKKKSRMIFILAQPILALKKLFRSTLPKAGPVYLLCNFPAENDVFENCKKKKNLGYGLTLFKARK